jgi:hypothetical protein
MVCKLDPKCEVQCDDCKSFYQRMSEKRNVVNEDDIYDISLFDWVEYMVDWDNKSKDEEQ